MSEPTSKSISKLPVKEEVEDEMKKIDEDESGSKVEEGRERLKTLREEVAGQVRIPEKWGQEQFMKDWIHLSSFDALLAPHTIIVAARDALIAEAAKPSSHRLRIQI